MSDQKPFDVLAVAFAHILEPVNNWIIPAASFVGIAAIAYLVYQRGRTKSWRGVLSYIFPKDLYRNQTQHVDRWHFALTVLLWLPISSLLGAFASAYLGINVSLMLNKTF